MGEQLLGNLVMITNDGRQIEFENAVVNSITENEETNIYNSFDSENNCIKHKNFEVECTIGNVSKKRFIKLLMGKGLQRNEALEISKYFYRKYKCYNPMHLILL